MIAGQAPNFQTGQDCEIYGKFLQFGGENFDKWTKYGQLARDGTTATAHGPACGHPKLGTIDQTDVTGPQHDGYATRHNPFVYFRGIIGNQAYCDSHVVTLRPLTADLAHAATRTSTSPACTARAAAGSARSRCRRSSSPAPRAPLLGDAKQPQVVAFGKDVFTG